MNRGNAGMAAWLAAAVVALGIVAAGAGTARAAAACGDGVLDSNEECDGGGTLYVDGDPAKGTCNTGSRCYFQFTCCKFNCQYVGTPGVPCQDGDNCSGPDTCDQVGVCHPGPPSVDGTPCDDGLFCNGAEGCQDGACVSGGSPCPETACNQCQEDTDSCLNPASSPCSDGSACVDGGNCDGSGNCVGGTFNSGPCDDGVFCNGADTCNGGTCSVHAGNPCPEGDGDGNCNEGCNEAAGNCTAPDPEGGSCDDGQFCNGAADQCDGAGACQGTGTTACDDLNSCTTDFCDEGLDSCMSSPLGDGLGCSDDDPCTLGDVCMAGTCTGTPTELEDFCPWTVIHREQPGRELLYTYFKTTITGDVCAGSLRFYNETTVTSDLVCNETTGDDQLRLAVDVVVGDDIVSAGAGATANPTISFLPMLDPQETVLPGGSLVSKSTGVGEYDLTGAHPLVPACNAARAAFPDHTAALDALASTSSIGPVRIGPGATSTLAVPNPGGLSVVDVDGSITVGSGGELVLDGGGSPDSVLVLRVANRLKLLVMSSVSLANGLTPDHLLIYVKGKKCRFSTFSIGAGTLVCSPGRVVARAEVAWVGAVFGDGKRLSTGKATSIYYSPFQGF